MSLEEAQEAALEEHNNLRGLHEDTEPLNLCAELCEEAQAYADLLMEEHRFGHATDLHGVGENLASATGDRTVVQEAIRATKSWYNEQSKYNYQNPGYNAATGHFTQVVWKKTKEFGIGIAERDGKFIVVGRYRPGGNMEGNFEANVARLIED